MNLPKTEGKRQVQTLITEKIDEDKNEYEYHSESVKELVRLEKRHFRKGEFYMETFAFDELILEREYNTVDLKLVVALKRRLDFNNRIKGFIQSDIAKEIRSSQPNVSKSLRKLEKDGVIFKDGIDYYFSDKFIKGAGQSKKRKSRTIEEE